MYHPAHRQTVAQVRYSGVVQVWVGSKWFDQASCSKKKPCGALAFFFFKSIGTFSLVKVSGIEAQSIIKTLLLIKTTDLPDDVMGIWNCQYEEKVHEPGPRLNAMLTNLGSGLPVSRVVRSDRQFVPRCAFSKFYGKLRSLVKSLNPTV